MRLDFRSLVSDKFKDYKVRSCYVNVRRMHMNAYPMKNESNLILPCNDVCSCQGGAAHDSMLRRARCCHKDDLIEGDIIVRECAGNDWSYTIIHSFYLATHTDGPMGKPRNACSTFSLLGYFYLRLISRSRWIRLEFEIQGYKWPHWSRSIRAIVCTLWNECDHSPSSNPGCRPSLICCHTLRIASDPRISPQCSRKKATSICFVMRMMSLSCKGVNTHDTVPCVHLQMPQKSRKIPRTQHCQR